MVQNVTNWLFFVTNEVELCPSAVVTLFQINFKTVSYEKSNLLNRRRMFYSGSLLQE
jgi:hypothetical protein